MSQVCELTGKRPAYGNKVSHSNIKSRTRWMPNLRHKTYMVPELMQSFSLLLSSRAIRTIDKLGGITPAIMKANVNDLSERLQQVRGKVYRRAVAKSAAGKTAEGRTAAKEAKVAKAAKVTEAKAAAAAAAAKPAKGAKAARAAKAAKKKAK